MALQLQVHSSKQIENHTMNIALAGVIHIIARFPGSRQAWHVKYRINARAPNHG